MKYVKKKTYVHELGSFHSVLKLTHHGFAELQLLSFEGDAYNQDSNPILHF